MIDCTQVDTERVVFGTKVTVVDLDSDEEVTYWLIGADEADVKGGQYIGYVALGTGLDR